MEKFPFDEQLLRYTILPDVLENQASALDLNVTEFGNKFLESSARNLYRPDWNLNPMIQITVSNWIGIRSNTFRF